MDFAEAVSQHLEWKQRLRRILLGRERRRDPGRTEAIECQACPLHQWLQHHASGLEKEPLFREIQESHRLSHDLAIRMVLNDDDEKDSLDMVFQIGQFHMCSRTLLEGLERLRQKYSLHQMPLCQAPPSYPRDEFPANPGGRA